MQVCEYVLGYGVRKNGRVDKFYIPAIADDLCGKTYDCSVYIYAEDRDFGCFIFDYPNDGSSFLQWIHRKGKRALLFFIGTMIGSNDPGQ